MNRRKLLQGLSIGGISLSPAARALTALQSSSPPLVQSTAIFTNQLGYLPGGVKHATLRLNGSSQRDFQVRSLPDHKVVLRGKVKDPQLDADSGDEVSLADFSELRTPGTYRLEIAGAYSDPITIRNKTYADALRVTMRGFYGQRCGCAVDLGNGYKHPICHAAGAFHESSGRAGTLPNHGGWHDAGDYGRYVVNSGITCGTLLWAWELYPQSLRDLALGIPHTAQPDYLAEVRWNLEWMLTLQDADGGVWHKQTSEQFSGFIMPQDDSLVSYVIGTGSAPYKSSCATGDFAAVMAIAARCYRPYDSRFADQCLAAARQAWTWTTAHPSVAFHNPPGIGTGAYGNEHCSDELAWASAELWRTTGESQFEDAFLSHLPGGTLKLIEPNWGGVLSMACWTYALADRPGKPDVKARIEAATHVAANAFLAQTQTNGYGNTLAGSDYIWGSNAVAANQSLLLYIADHLHPDPVLRDAALNNLHYLMGRNCHGVSWVTQLGVRPFQHPHHRPSAADGIEAPWPGLLSGGPNAHGGDVIAAKLTKRPPMRMWLDDQEAYSLNEIAINWNAPLVFLLAAANS